MATISMDLDTSQSVIYLLGDIKQLIDNRFAWRYIKDYLNPSIRTDRICIPVVDKDVVKVLSDIRAMLKKYGFKEEQSETSDQILKDFYEEERRFLEFSQKALQIRNNECPYDEFKAFTDSVAKSLPTRSLYPLQLLSAYHLAFAQNACNFSVPGSGKTSIVYGAYAYLKNLPYNDLKKVDRLLIVGPLSSFGPWELEYAECFGRIPQSKRLISGITREDKIDYLYSSHTYELTLISYASLASVQDAIMFFLKHNRVMVVLDEAHKAKNTSGGITAQTILEISKYCKSRVVLTGTPSPNGYEDLYNMFKFIWPSKNIIGFEVNQLKTITAHSDPRIGRLIERISPFFIRIRKSDLNIPAPTVHPPIEVEMGPAQRRIYDFIERRYFESLLQDSTAEVTSRFKSLLMQAKTIRLMQAASNPAMLKTPLYTFLEDDECPQEAYQAVNDADVLKEIFDYATKEIPAKYAAAKSLIDKIITNGGKVVVWATFVHTILEFQEYLSQHSIAAQTLYGAIPVEQEGIVEDSDDQVLTRERIVRGFQGEDCPYKVIIANPFAVAESISLHKACHNAIYLERSFNAAHFVQSKDRIHRYGLKPHDATHYYFIIAKDSIDETIDTRLAEKELRMTEIMESMPIPLFENVSTDLGKDDIKALIKDYVRRTRKN